MLLFCQSPLQRERLAPVLWQIADRSEVSEAGLLTYGWFEVHRIHLVNGLLVQHLVTAVVLVMR